MHIPTEILSRAEAWLTDVYDENTKREVQALIDDSSEELIDAFYKDMEFGTGGMRGIMGSGTNRINKYTLGAATQGLSNYLKASFEGTIKVAIAYDCRNNSDTFSKIVADVLSANGVHVYLFESLRPTPELSYAVRELNCQSGIVLTASHNPKEYNGYKVYWNDGAQLVPPHDKNVIEEVRKIKHEDIQFDSDSSKIEIIGEAMDQSFIDAVVNQSMSDVGKDDLSIVFTSIHGTSIKSVPPALEKAGFSQVHIVEEQAVPDGNFPTVVSPNPEEAEALTMALNKADEVNADLVIGTDPDADRIGIAVRDNAGAMKLLNGNQTAAIMTWYMLDQWKQAGKLSGNQYIAATIVTTDLLEDIATDYNVPTYFCLTGFKWIADVIREREGKEEFICGGEESYGFMIGDFVRDKDSVTAAMIISEIAAWAKANGSSIYQELIKIYVNHGHYQERLISITKKGKSGAEEIQQMMVDFRLNTPETINGVKVVQTKDFQSSEARDFNTGETTTIDLPQSNVFQIFLADGSKITARPSGTEPKIKFYISVNDKLECIAHFENQYDQLQKRIDAIVDAMAIN